MPFIDVRAGNARQGCHLLMSGQEMLKQGCHLLMSKQEMLGRDAIY